MSDAQKDPVFGRAGEDLEQIYDHLRDPKEQLLDELTDLMLQGTEEELDSDRLDQLLDALDEIDPLPELEAFDTQKSLERFRREHADLFASVEAAAAVVSDPSSDKKPSRHAFFKYLPIAALLVLLLGSATAQAFGVDVLGVIAHWSSEIFQLNSRSTPYAAIQTVPLAEGESAAYETLEDAVEAFGITAPIVPQWLPERFTLTEVTATNRSSGIMIYADYISDDGFFQIRYKETAISDLSSLEQEGADVKMHTQGNIRHYLLYDLGRYKVFWQNGELECRMSGTATEQEMKDIIDSIY